MAGVALILLVSIFFTEYISVQSQKPVSTLLVNQGITDGQQLVSPSGIFVLGFFSPSNSALRYLGIWYQNMQPQTVVWVANRDKPITGSKGSFNISSSTVDIYNNNTLGTWSTGMLAATISQCNLLDSGNFRVTDSSNNTLWQTFDHFVDTLLPGMKMGYDLTGQRYINSWKSDSDPSFGSYSYKLDQLRLNELVLFFQDSTVMFRSGSWNGGMFDGVPNARTTPLLSYHFVNSNTNGVNSSFFWYEVVSTGLSLWRLVMGTDGNVHRYFSQGSSWSEFYHLPQNDCDKYNHCGPNGMCTGGACSCLAGFVVRNESEWGLHNYSSGCVRSPQVNCTATSSFIPLQNVKVPDTLQSSIYTLATLNTSKCMEWCTSNCSCTAFAMLGGCITWHGDLLDMQQFSISFGDQLFVKVPQAMSPPLQSPSSTTSNITLYAGLAAGGAVLLVVAGVIVFCIIQSKRKRAEAGNHVGQTSKKSVTTEKDAITGFMFELDTLQDATDGFADTSLLGRGLFGRVYKGTLADGRKIAVKRLSQGSPHGLAQMTSEIRSLANLSHRNLVKLLGFYIGEDEKLLCYEYMPNGSLDRSLFAKDAGFDWRTRVSIIKGIADGLLYLHEEANVTVVHRDIKPSNILLAEDLTPKIGDFGLSRLFDADQTTIETLIIMGTLGYMAPELQQGRFSTKSDVYSFGILILEMVAGKKNHPFSNVDFAPDLLSYVQRQWSLGIDLKLIKDPRMGVASSGELIHFIHVALLCTQEEPSCRPSMRQVIVMLSSDSVTLPMVPNSPSAFTGTDNEGFSSSESSRVQAR